MVLYLNYTKLHTLLSQTTEYITLFLFYILMSVKEAYIVDLFDQCI